MICICLIDCTHTSPAAILLIVDISSWFICIMKRKVKRGCIIWCPHFQTFTKKSTRRAAIQNGHVFLFFRVVPFASSFFFSSQKKKKNERSSKEKEKTDTEDKSEVRNYIKSFSIVFFLFCIVLHIMLGTSKMENQLRPL